MATYKGGAITLSAGDNWTEPGAAAVLRSSTFRGNDATVDKGGVVYLGNFVNVTVQGEGNVFKENTCGTDGAVFAVSADAIITVEDGIFSNNTGKVRALTATKHPRPLYLIPLFICRLVLDCLGFALVCCVFRRGYAYLG